MKRDEEGQQLEDVTMKIKEYAQHVKIGQGTIRRFAKIEGFPVLHIGRRQLVLVEQADQWIIAQAAGQGAPSLMDEK